MYAHRQTGFSLLEAIVTLVIFSLLITVLMQALQHALQVRQRVVRHQQVARTDALQSRWFRDSVAAVIATATDEGLTMEGDEREMRIFTQTTLEGRALGPVRWRLQPMQGGDELRYQSDGWGGEVSIMRGPLSDVRFSYMDEQGGWNTSWQPDPADGVRLPRAVLLEGDGPTGTFTWVVAIRGNRKPATLKLPPEVFL